MPTPAVPAVLADRSRRSERYRLQRHRIAHGSEKETDTRLRLLVGAGLITTEGAGRARRLFDDVRAVTWKQLQSEQ